MNTKNVIVNSSVDVGDDTQKVVILENLVALPPMTNSEILLIPSPEEGSIAYSSASDVLILFDGVRWRRVDGQNNNYLDIPCEGALFADFDGNTFEGVEIGTQCWMKENLKVTHFPNGEAIPYIADFDTWKNLANSNTAVAYCYYFNTQSYADTYGNLYTYATAIASNWTKDNDEVTNAEGGQGICPDGWHLPTNPDWALMINYLGTWTDAGGEMKEAGITHWTNPNTGATNSSGFTALPGGKRNHDSGNFVGEGVGLNGHWWAASPNGGTNAYNRKLTNSLVKIDTGSPYKSSGLSVRCVRN